jgi:anti-anti-sigma factor
MVTTEPVSGDVVVIVVDGEFDIGSTNLIADAVTMVLDRGHRQLVIDLQGTTFLDCSSLSALLAAVAPLHYEPEAAVVLAGASGIVARLLDLVGARQHLPLAGSRSAAIEALHITSLARP